MEYNYDEVCDVLGIDRELLDELLTEFLQGVDKQLEDIKKDMDNKDYKSLDKRVHALKGVCSNLRLTHMEVELVCLDKLLKNSKLNTNFSYYESFDRLMVYSWEVKENFIDLL
jgi:HPt (histidine-containing phosphotransfer) domain-containing protein